jgi:hypothetical protein
LGSVPREKFESETGLNKKDVVALYLHNAINLADHYLRDATAADGVPYWDDGAPGLAKMGDWQKSPADPFNEFEPVDSSAAAIAAQGLWRLGKILGKQGSGYTQAAINIADTLFDEPYLSTDKKHQGLLLHSIYHRPNNWDAIPKGKKIPSGESSMWGDYHALELALLLYRAAGRKEYITFFDS